MICIYKFLFLYFSDLGVKKEKKKNKKMYKAVVYQGEELLGEVEIYPEEKEKEKKKMMIEVKEIRINQFTQSSERCPPLAVLHTITCSGICFKMESKSSLSQQEDSPLFLLHSSCFTENKV